MYPDKGFIMVDFCSVMLVPSMIRHECFILVVHNEATMTL